MNNDLIADLKAGIQQRIEKRLSALNLTARKAGILAGLGPDGIRNILRDDVGQTKNLPRIDTLARLSVALECDPAWLTFGSDHEATTEHDLWRIPVRAQLSAGVWRAEKTDLPELLLSIAIPPQPGKLKSTLYGAVIEGLSMNLIYPPGTIVIFETVVDRPSEIVTGARYHIERSSPDGLVENTIKTVTRDKHGKLWLVPESTEPEFRTPIPAEAADGYENFYVGRAVCALVKA